MVLLPGAYCMIAASKSDCRLLGAFEWYNYDMFGCYGRVSFLETGCKARAAELVMQVPTATTVMNAPEADKRAAFLAADLRNMLEHTIIVRRMCPSTVISEVRSGSQPRQSKVCIS